MIHHVAMFTFSEPQTPEHIAFITKTLHDMRSTMPYVKSYVCGPDAGLAGNNDYVVIASFDNEDDWSAYHHDDLHNKIRAEVFAPIVKERSVIQVRS